MNWIIWWRWKTFINYDVSSSSHSNVCWTVNITHSQNDVIWNPVSACKALYMEAIAFVSHRAKCVICLWLGFSSNDGVTTCHFIPYHWKLRTFLPFSIEIGMSYFWQCHCFGVWLKPYMCKWYLVWMDVVVGRRFKVLYWVVCLFLLPNVLHWDQIANTNTFSIK